MKRLAVRSGWLVLLSVVLGFAQQPAGGIAPRAKADDYAARAQEGDTVYAASLIPAKQVKNLFAFDISGEYLVFEVACYINPSSALQIQRDNFVVKGRAQGELTHEAEADTVASVTQQKNLPKPASRRPDVGGAVGVGYETYTDPVTGRKVHGVYTDAEVGVGIGNNGSAQRYPTPGGLPEDRELLRNQLLARSLPEGKLDRAVAGYLYFPRAGLKPQPDGTYLLKYLIDSGNSGASKEVSLTVPVK
jgi:hypothetical protein